MRKWLYDNPWIWIVLFLAIVVVTSLVLIGVAEYHKPVLVR